MSDKKNIDRLFQETFKDFDVAPNDGLWDGIESRLHKKRKRRVIPIWWRVGGVAAALILMFTIGNAIFNSTEDIKPIIVDTDNTSNPSDVIINKENNNSPTLNNPSTVVASENNDETIQPTTNSSEQNDVSNAILNKNEAVTNIRDYTNAVAQNSKENSQNSSKNKTNTILKNPIDTDKSASKVAVNSEKTNPVKSQSEIDKILDTELKKDNVTVVTDLNDSNKTKEEDAQIDPSKAQENNTEKGQSIEEAIAEANTITEKEEELNRWSISPNVAPVYFSSLGRGSAIGPEFDSNGTATDITVSYGLEGSYTINKRLKVRAGVNRVNFNRATENVLALSGSGAVARGSTAQVSNITLNSNSQATTLISSSRISNDSAPQSVITLPTGNLEQRYGFIEVPLELEYRVIDRKLGVNLIGGFSTFFLNENDIFTNIDGNTTLIGEANNLNDTSYSANLGIGLNYSFSKQININLEPKFKYQLNTFNNTSENFQPFFIGIYTGLSFKF